MNMQQEMSRDEVKGVSFVMRMVLSIAFVMMTVLGVIGLVANIMTATIKYDDIFLRGVSHRFCDEMACAGNGRFEVSDAAANAYHSALFASVLSYIGVIVAIGLIAALVGRYLLVGYTKSESRLSVALHTMTFIGLNSVTPYAISISIALMTVHAVLVWLVSAGYRRMLMKSVIALLTILLFGLIYYFFFGGVNYNYDGRIVPFKLPWTLSAEDAISSIFFLSAIIPLVVLSFLKKSLYRVRGVIALLYIVTLIALYLIASTIKNSPTIVYFSFSVLIWPLVAIGYIIACRYSMKRASSRHEELV